MKVLTNISGTPKDIDWREPHCHHQHIGQSHRVNAPDGEKHADYSRAMRVGPAGIIFTNGKVSFVIPEDELWKAAEKYEPGLCVPVSVPNVEIQNAKPPK